MLQSRGYISAATMICDFLPLAKWSLMDPSLFGTFFFWLYFVSQVFGTKPLMLIFDLRHSLTYIFQIIHRSDGPLLGITNGQSFWCTFRYQHEWRSLWVKFYSRHQTDKRIYLPNRLPSTAQTMPYRTYVSKVLQSTVILTTANEIHAGPWSHGSI